MAADAGVPVVFHVGGTGELLDRNYFNNGLPMPPDFHGGRELPVGRLHGDSGATSTNPCNDDF